MNIGQPSSAPDAGSVRLEKLKDSMDAKSMQSTNPEELARELEALFVSMMIKQMRQSDAGEGLFPGDRSDTLGGLFDDAMGQEISSVGGLGVADLIRQTSTTPLGIQAYRNASGAFVHEYADAEVGQADSATGVGSVAIAR